MRIIALVALCVVAVSAVPTDPQRIVGGSTVHVYYYPTIAALLYSSGSLLTYTQACGGTILNNRSILTAAHCTLGDAAIQWRSRLGSSYANSGGFVYTTASILNHPDYNSRTYDNDIAILRTDTTIIYNDYIQPVTVAGANYNLADHDQLWAAGWGSTYYGGPASNELRHVQVLAINQLLCRYRYTGVGIVITDNMLCSGWIDQGGRDQCQGDSGGPLYHNNVLVGVCSFGQGCGAARYPGVNTRVSNYITWLHANA